jgi:hypothetical protein
MSVRLPSLEAQKSVLDLNGRLAMIAESHSGSELLRRLLYGPLVSGKVYSPGHLRFGDYVVSITRPGSLRMPNGIECDLKVRLREKVAMGGGRLVVGATVVSPGAVWNPVPSFIKPRGLLPAGPEPLLPISATPDGRSMSTGDCVLAAYVAGLVLLHGQRDRAGRVAERAAARANAMSATMFRHAALGEVPEGVHILLATGETNHLVSSRDPSGPAWLRGLVSAGYPVEVDALLGRAVGGAS